jgi:glycyl-tRNA synthetase beta chain
MSEVRTRNYLLEIGTEDLPASVQDLWRESLGLSDFLEDVLVKFRLNYVRESIAGSLEAKDIIDVMIQSGLHTPRRLTVFIKYLPEKQKDVVNKVKGPAISAAFDKEDNPTQAAIGFAKSKGIEIKDLVKEDDGYVYAEIKIAGKPTVEVIPEIAKDFISTFASRIPKTMRWGPKGVRFARPIRWIVSVYGNEVVPFEIDGIKASNITFGHRFLGGKIEISKIDDLKTDYLDKLEKNCVFADFFRRRKLIDNQINKLCEQNKLNAKNDEYESLLTEVTNLVEYPTAVLGSFDKKFLELPKQVLETSMRSHQRYCPLDTENGSIFPGFIVVHNGSPDANRIITKGNERVLTARLEDAHFFYTEDTKSPLASYIPKLKGLVFHSKLGSMAQKTARVELLAKEICKQFGVDSETTKMAIRAAGLCKADLVTHMVIEFPSLQGTMGSEYALASGEDRSVAKAIYEHYLPKGRYGSSAQLPESKLGQIIALADKIDSASSLLAFERPTASRDPYGIRRQITGVIRIIVEKKVPVGLSSLINVVINWTKKNKIKTSYGGYKELAYSFLEELGNYKETVWDEELLRDESSKEKPATRPWAARAVISSQKRRLQEEPINLDLLKINLIIDSIDDSSVKALSDIHTAYSRCKNLLPKGFLGNKIDESLFEDGDAKLFGVLSEAEKRLNEFLQQEKFGEALKILARLRQGVDTFFDEVLVMAKDETVKINRLSLLKKSVEIYEKIADFSELKPEYLE